MTQAPASRIRLMMVDDHEVVRIGLRALFARGKTIEVVAEAASAAEAVRVARNAHPDVVLMDLRLPDGSGIEACREIRATEPSARVLFLTSFPDEQAVTATILAGASGYLLKEIGQEALVRAIEAVASGKSILDPSVTQSVLTRLQEKAERPNGRRGADLSAQESRICALVVEGKTNKEIAAVLGLSDKTVKNYLSNAFQKLQVSRRSQAAAVFVRVMNDSAAD
jgi:two-component system, NarL family, response regulator DevR